MATSQNRVQKCLQLLQAEVAVRLTATAFIAGLAVATMAQMTLIHIGLQTPTHAFAISIPHLQADLATHLAYYQFQAVKSSLTVRPSTPLFTA